MSDRPTGVCDFEGCGGASYQWQKWCPAHVPAFEPSPEPSKPEDAFVNMDGIRGRPNLAEPSEHAEPCDDLAPGGECSWCLSAAMDECDRRNAEPSKQGAGEECVCPCCDAVFPVRLVPPHDCLANVDKLSAELHDPPAKAEPSKEAGREDFNPVFDAGFKQGRAFERALPASLPDDGEDKLREREKVVAYLRLQEGPAKEWAQAAADLIENGDHDV